MLEKIGLGIDIVDINKFKKITYQSNKSFYDKIFTPSEIKYCLKLLKKIPNDIMKSSIKLDKKEKIQLKNSIKNSLF